MQEEAEQTADHFSEQTRSCTAQGEPGDEDRPDETGGDCPAGGRHGQGVLFMQRLLNLYEKEKHMKTHI